MGKSVYIRRRELYDKWSGMYKINIFGMSFDDFSRLREEETKYYKHWLFYDKLIKKNGGGKWWQQKEEVL